MINNIIEPSDLVKVNLVVCLVQLMNANLVVYLLASVDYRLAEEHTSE